MDGGVLCLDRVTLGTPISQRLKYEKILFAWISALACPLDYSDYGFGETRYPGTDDAKQRCQGDQTVPPDCNQGICAEELKMIKPDPESNWVGKSQMSNHHHSYELLDMV